MSPDVILAGMMLSALVIYVLTGGADFGAGVWSLLAWGRRGRQHRDLIDHAIAPIWEANHVWLILVVTVLFAGFPRAFAMITTALHLPLTALLIAIVLRGAAFVFRTYDVEPRRQQDGPQRFWARVFSGSSIFAPLMLGTTVGAIASGRLPDHPLTMYEAFVAPWLGIFPLLVGCFTLSLFLYLAAIYLIFETADRGLQADFRRRALISWVGVSIVGVAVLIASKPGAPDIYEGLFHTDGGRLTLGLTALASFASLAGLAFFWFGLARAAAAAQVTLIVFGWAAAQYPYLVVPSVRLDAAGAPVATIELLIWTLVIGALVLFPCLYYLYRIFKWHALSLSPLEPEDKANCPPADILSKSRTS